MEASVSTTKLFSRVSRWIKDESIFIIDSTFHFFSVFKPLFKIWSCYKYIFEMLFTLHSHLDIIHVQQMISKRGKKSMCRLKYPLTSASTSSPILIGFSWTFSMIQTSQCNFIQVLLLLSKALWNLFIKITQPHERPVSHTNNFNTQ